MVRNIFFNPFVVYSLSWLFVLLIYRLKWSELYPHLPAELLLFSMATIFFSGFIGLYLYSKKCFRYYPIPYNFHQIKKWINIYLILNLLEILYSRHLPIVNIALGNKGGDYGIPVFHPFVVTFGIFLGLYIFHMMLSSTKIERKRLIPYFSISFIAVIIIFGRGLMFLTIIGCLMIFIYSRQMRFKILISTSLVMLIFLFLFGLAGDVRIGSMGVKITSVGKASENFEKSWVPNTFFWSYIYISSPMANLAINVNPKSEDARNANIWNLFYTEILPETITKRISKQEKIEPDLINSALNVSSVYTRCYVIAGWTGIILMFVYIMAYLIFFLLIIPPNSPYFIVLISLLTIMMIGNVFDNMMNYLLSYTLFFPVCFHLMKNIRFKLKPSNFIVNKLIK